MEDPGKGFPDRATHGDAFGEMVRAAYHRQPALGATERDDGRTEPHDARAYLAPPQHWHALDLTACDRAVGRVLDIGCGAGRHAVYLQARGHPVTGIDTSTGAVHTARERGLRDVHELDITRVGALDLRFDTVLLLGGNLGLLGSPRQAADVLHSLAAQAAPGARVLAHGTDPYASFAGTQPAYQARNRARGWMPGQVRCRVRFHQLVGPWRTLLHCSLDELSTLLAGSPWRVRSSRVTEQNYLVELGLR